MLHGLDAEGVDAEAAEVVRRIARALADEAPRQGTPAPVPSGGGARGTTCLSCFAFGRSAVPATVRKVESMMTRTTGTRGERGRRGRGRERGGRERGGARRGSEARRERGEASKRVAQRQQQQRVLWLRCRAAIGPPTPPEQRNSAASAKHESSLEVSPPRPEYYSRRSGFCPSPRGWFLAISREGHLGAAERCRSGCATWVRVRSRAVSSGSERAFVQHQHHRQQQQQHGNFSLLSSPAATTPILALAHAHHELVRSRVVARASTLVAP